MWDTSNSDLAMKSVEFGNSGRQLSIISPNIKDRWRTACWRSNLFQVSENRNITQWLSVRMQTDYSSFCLLTRLNTEEGTFILCVDYYFVIKWSEFAEIENKSCLNTVIHLKSLFSKYGIPDTVISDNGPQCSTTTFANFSVSYGFVQKISNPQFAQSNREAERNIQTLKILLKKARDPYRAMLSYRNTTLDV